jgi:hypothetical protein
MNILMDFFSEKKNAFKKGSLSFVVFVREAESFLSEL